MSTQVQNHWLDLINIPHIGSAIFQHLYHTDIQRYISTGSFYGGLLVEESTFVDFGDDAFNFCKAANMNIYKEKVKLLNALHKEKQRINPKALEASKFICRCYQIRIDDPTLWVKASDEDIAKYNAAHATINRKDEVEFMIGSTKKYLNFNRNYNREYEPNYLFKEDSDLGGWFPKSKKRSRKSKKRSRKSLV